MQFFIPKATDERQARELYEGARAFCEQQTGWKTTDRRICALRYRHDGVEHFARVGSLDSSEGLVICIFETAHAYLVCTPERGVIRSFPILVGRAEISDIEEFDTA